MKNYVKLNQDNRINAKNEVEQDFFKLMNNSLFGKTCENQKKRTKIKLVNNRQDFQNLVNKPQFMDCRRFSDTLAAVEMQKTQLRINKPSHVGFVVLELAKLIMYEYVNVIYFYQLKFKNLESMNINVNGLIEEIFKL